MELYRELTSGEITMLQKVFGNSINYNDVKIANNMGVLDRGGSVNGNILIPSSQYHIDFSQTDNPVDKVLFVHEMTHVWQSQNEYLVGPVGFILQGVKELTGDKVNPYRYDLSGNKSFSDFNMEAQADLVSHYYSLTELKSQGMGDAKAAYATAHEAELKAVVGSFVNSDHSSNWTPSFDSVKEVLLSAGNKIVAQIENAGNVLTSVEKSAYEAMGFIVYDPASTNTTSYKDTTVITLTPSTDNTLISYDSYDTKGTKTSTTVSAYSNTGDLLGRSSSEHAIGDFIAVPNANSPASVIETLQQTTANSIGSATQALNVASMVGLDKVRKIA